MTMVYSPTNSSISEGRTDIPRRMLLRLTIMGPNDALNAALQTRMAHAPSGSTTFSTLYASEFGKDFRVRDMLLENHHIRVQIHKESSLERTELEWAESGGARRAGRRWGVWEESHAVFYCLDPAAPLTRANATLAFLKSAVPYLPRLLVATSPPNDHTQEEQLNILAEGQRVALLNVQLKDGNGVEAGLAAGVKEALSYALILKVPLPHPQWPTSWAQSKEEDRDSGFSAEVDGGAPRPCYECRVS